MKQKVIKLQSLQQLANIAYPEYKNREQWELFLKEKGHSDQTFSYLPEDLKTALRFSFAKKTKAA